MAIDFVHTSEVVDAVIAVLTGSGAAHYGGLPASWFQDSYTSRVGTGLNDVTFRRADPFVVGTYTVEIVLAGGGALLDTFRWKLNSGAWSTATNCAASVALGTSGVSVRFAATQGHMAGESWTFAALDHPLVLLEHGDLADFPTDEIEDLSPSIVVRGLGPRSTGRGGTAGHRETVEVVRIIHLRSRAQTVDAAGALETNLTRARERYAKTIGKALFNDPKGRLAVISSAGARTEVNLTCADGADAQLQAAIWRGWDLGNEFGSADSMEEVTIMRRRPAHVWAIGCEIEVVIDTGGQG